MTPRAQNITSPATQPPALPRWKVEHLLRGGREAIILHQNDEYRLRLTQNDKLILTK